MTELFLVELEITNDGRTQQNIIAPHLAHLNVGRQSTAQPHLVGLDKLIQHTDIQIVDGAHQTVVRLPHCSIHH